MEIITLRPADHAIPGEVPPNTPAIRASLAAWVERVASTGDTARRGQGGATQVRARLSNSCLPQRFGDSYRWPDGIWTHSG